MVTIDQLNEMSGRIEALGRMILHLSARLEDAGLIDGPAYCDGLRHSVVLREGASILMTAAHETLMRVAQSMDEAREWRKFRRQVVPQGKATPRHRRNAA
jgi:hypothetical protein